MKDVMIDLETLGTRPGSVIFALGAAEFANGQIVDTFYERIDIENALSHGMTVDAPTLQWWMLQPDQARQQMTLPGKDVVKVLLDFEAWLGTAETRKTIRVWGNGAAFDNALLAELYQMFGCPPPWQYRNNRCYRTVDAMYPQIERPRHGTAHHALDDAISQAVHLMDIFTHIRSS